MQWTGSGDMLVNHVSALVHWPCSMLQCLVVLGLCAPFFTQTGQFRKCSCRAGLAVLEIYLIPLSVFLRILQCNDRSSTNATPLAQVLFSVSLTSCSDKHFFSYFAYNVTVWGLPPLIDLLFLFLTQPQIVQWVLCNKCITMQCLRCCYLNYKLHVNNCILHINKKTAMATKLQNSYSWYVQFLQIISNTTTQTVPLSYLLSTKLFPFPDNKTPYLCKNGINNLHNNCACAAFAGYIVTFPCLFISKFKLVFTWA